MFRAKLRTLVCKPPVNCSVTHKPLDNKNNGTCYDCYQFVIKRLIEIAETRINTGFFKQLDLFKLNRSWWFAGQIIEYAVYPFYFVDDSAHHFLQSFKRNLRCLGGHEVDGVYGAEGHGVVVGSFVSHNANGTHVGEGGEILADGAVKTDFGDFFAVDGIGILNDTDFFGGYFADDTDTQTRARERLAEYQIFRDAQFETALRTSSLKRSRSGSMISLKFLRNPGGRPFAGGI